MTSAAPGDDRTTEDPAAGTDGGPGDGTGAAAPAHEHPAPPALTFGQCAVHFEVAAAHTDGAEHTQLLEIAQLLQKAERRWTQLVG